MCEWSLAIPEEARREPATAARDGRGDALVKSSETRKRGGTRSGSGGIALDFLEFRAELPLEGCRLLAAQIEQEAALFER